MINIPTTDILTLITGEVEKPATVDRGENTDVSFLSVIAGEETDTDAQITGPDLSLIAELRPNPTAGHVGVTAAFPAVITVPKSALPPQNSQLSAPNRFDSPTIPPIYVSALTDVANKVPNEPGTTLIPISDASDQMLIAGRATDVSLPVETRMPVRMVNPTGQPNNDIPVPSRSNIVGSVGDVVANSAAPAKLNAPIVAQANAFIPDTSLPVMPTDTSVEQRPTIPVDIPMTSTGSQDKAASIQPSPNVPHIQNRPIEPTYIGTQHPTEEVTDDRVELPKPTPTLVPPSATFPVIPANTSAGKSSVILVDPPKMSVATQNKPATIQLPPNIPQTQGTPDDSINFGPLRSPVEPASDRAQLIKPMTAPVQAAAPRPAQMPTVDLPLGRTESSTPARDQITAPKTDVAHPDLVQPSPMPQSQNLPEVSTRPERPPKDNQTPVQGSQARAKQPQRTEAVPAQPAQPIASLFQPSVMATQITPRPTGERNTVKPNGPPMATPPAGATVPNRAAQTPPPSGATPVVTTTETTPLDAVEPLSLPEFMPQEVRGTDSASLVRSDASINRPEVMRHVAQQLADVARQMPDRPVELALNPEELGRVRLTFTATDGGIHVAVMAERGETMDLLRRHIDTLAQEFREMGYKDVNFEFSRNGQGANGDGEPNAQNSADPDAGPAETESLAPVQLSLEPSTGLDLRL